MYFPKSQIITNLQTNGEEFTLIGKSISYIGSYYSTSTGKYYTGINPNDGQNKELIPITGIFSSDLTPFKEGEGNSQRSLNSLEYNIININDQSQQDADNIIDTPKGVDWLSNYQNNVDYSQNKDLKDRAVPPQETIFPTPKELNKGYYMKYYVRDIRNTSYYEISKQTYKAMSSSDLFAKDLYESIALNFAVGKENNNINNAKIQSVEQKLKWMGFFRFISFGKNQKYLNSNGGEFLLPNRTNYIGYYHYMPNGNVMTGKYHGDGPEITLISLKPISQSPQQIQENSTKPTISTPLTSGGGGGGY